MIEFLNLALANKDMFTSIILIWVIVYQTRTLNSSLKTLKKDTVVSLSTLWETFISTFNKHEIEERTLQKDLVTRFIKHEADDKEQFKELQQNFWKTTLSQEQTLVIFRAVLDKHIRAKILFLKNKLEINWIQTRKDSLKLQIKAEFEKITQQEASILSWFATPAWNIWEVLLWVMKSTKDWNKFLEDVYEVFFSKEYSKDLDKTAVINQKLDDISAIMSEIVNWLVKQIESKF